MGAREALKPLLHVLGQERSERVILAAGEAMSRLGAFEAALEILPRMHAAESPVVQRQFAIAMGNLLGAPGEFYPIVTGDDTARSIALEKLKADAQRNLQALASTLGGRRDPHGVREALMGAGKRLRETESGDDLGELIEILHALLLDLCQVLAGRTFSEDEATGYAFMHNPKLGLGLWFASEVKSRLAALRGTQMLEIDALLGMYFLASYREGDVEEEE
jgi:hypothetical protein